MLTDRSLLRGGRAGIERAILLRQSGAGGLRSDISRGCNVRGKRSRHEFQPVGRPCVGLLLRAEMRDDEQALQLEHGLLEALVARFRLRLARVAQLKRCHRAMFRQRLPDRSRVVRDAALRVEALRGFCRGHRFAHGEEMGKKLQRDKCSARLEVLGVERSPLPWQLVLPCPEFCGVFVPSDGDSARHGIVQRRQLHIFHGKEQAEAGRIDEADSVGRGVDASGPGVFADFD